MSGSIYPYLRPGISYLISHDKENSSILVGNGRHGICLTGHNAIALIKQINGEVTLEEIMTEIGIPRDTALEIIQKLIANGLINLASAPNPTTLDSEDLSQKINLARLQPELNLLAWKSQTPIADIVKRAELKVLILGRNRLAITLLKLFISSGFTKTAIDPGFPFEITADLIGGTPFGISEIGSSSKSAIGKIYREFSLNLSGITRFAKKLAPIAANNSESRAKSEPEEAPDLVISTSDFALELLPNYLSEGINHFQIGNFQSGKLELGPIVIPGQTPCYNCIEMWRMENLKKLTKLRVGAKVAIALEIPATSVSFIAGLVTTYLSSFLTTGKSFLIGSSILVDLAKPLEYLERFWQPNPNCGCLELL